MVSDWRNWETWTEAGSPDARTRANAIARDILEHYEKPPIDDAIEAGEKVLLVDDLLATGGTAEAGIRLIERLGGEIVGCAFIVDLPDLGGRARLERLGMEVHALCAFPGA